jgi:hypothetical protein
MLVAPLLAVLLVVASGTACGGGATKPGHGRNQTQTALTRTAAAPAASPTTAGPTPGTTPTATLPPARTSSAGLPVGGPGRPVERRTNVSSSVVLKSVEVGKIARQEAVTFTFSGNPPTIRASVVTEPPACGPAIPPAIDGAVAYLVIGLSPVTTKDFSGRPTLAASEVAGIGGTVISGMLTCEEGDSQAWLFGLTREAEFELGASGDQAGVLLDPR